MRPSLRTRPTVGAVALVLVLAPLAALAESDDPSEQERPPYRKLRFEEDWSALADAPPPRPDYADPLKHVALSADGEVWASFGGQLRQRIEAWQDFGFADERDDVFALWRVRLHGDLHLGPHVRVFAELKSALASDRDLPGGKRTADVDNLALQNGFLELRAPLGEAELLLRGGRQELLFGRERLVSPANWRNTRRTFDGVSARLAVGDWTTTAFWMRPVVVDKHDGNGRDDDTEFFGVYAAGRVPRTGVGLDLYVLSLEREVVSFNATAGGEDRLTIGGRLHHTPEHGLDAELEGALQTGESGAGDLRAGFATAEVGWRFDHRLRPRVGVGLGWSSGDEQPGGDVETFDPLFPTGHAYLGYADVVGRFNVTDARMRFSFAPFEDLSVGIDTHFFWRSDDDDALYAPSGAVVRPPTASARYVGAEIDLLVRYELDRHTAVLVGWSHFEPGPFIEDTGPDDAIDFAYLVLQWTF